MAQFSEDIDFGKRITEESIVKGAVKSVKKYELHSVFIQTKTNLMDQLMNGLGLLETNKTHDLTIRIMKDPTTKQYRRMEKKWVITD